MLIYRHPLDDLEIEAAEKHETRRGCSSKDWRRKHCRSHPVRFPTLSDVNIIITAMKRE
jgi:hypothetical protein